MQDTKYFLSATIVSELLQTHYIISYVFKCFFLLLRFKCQIKS